MKTVSVLVPTYNEQDNVVPLSEAIIREFSALPNYDYEIVFIDNHSKDNTRAVLRKLCAENKKIKAIFNCKNFGQFNSPFHGLTQMTGDCVILMCADFQDPVDMIPKFIQEWENGYKIVIGIKTKSKESKLMYLLRSIYYKTIKKISRIDHIENFTGFGLYDKAFIKVLRKIRDPLPYLRGIVAELGFDRKEIPYTQQKRLHGKTSNNWFTLYDVGMLGITSYSKTVMRLATISGFIASVTSMIIGLVYLVLKLIYWDRFSAGTAPILIGTFFTGALILFFIGFLGEYILNINIRVMNRPLVVEEERLNFTSEEESESETDEN
ncbi:MAG: glycosyltransferase family 2 protein [Eubacteriales bacterium]|nr:glycosyltransferase family 2 protein [Eubacteriales bacterium]